MNLKRLVSVKNVSFGYDSQRVLDNVSLDVFAGDYIGIVGPNGSGKSTLLKIILGILKPSKGSVEILGQKADSFKEWESIGYVRQKATSFNPGFPATVEEVIAANVRSKAVRPKGFAKTRRDKAYQALSVVNMQKFGCRLIGSLSGGQQQRVFIARALVNSPEVLFLDEPTVGIDVDSQREFYGLLEKLNRDMHITIVMVSHDIGVITEKVNRIVCMGDGKLICHRGNPHHEMSDVLKRAYGDRMNLLIHDH